MLELYNRHGWLHSVRSILTIGALVIAVFAAFLLDRPAKAAPITLGTAANYGVLVGSGQTLALNGGVSIAGNVGVGSGSAVQLSGINAVSGTAYEDSGVAGSETALPAGYSERLYNEDLAPLRHRVSETTTVLSLVPDESRSGHINSTWRVIENDGAADRGRAKRARGQGE